MITSNSNNLIGHKDLFSELFNLHDKNLLPSKLLFTGSKGIGKNLLSLHLINYIFSIDEDFKYDKVKRKINDNNKSNKLVINNSHPNLINIELKKDKKFIDVNQIREINGFINKSSFNNQKKIILIDGVENLNINAVNALLKNLEDSDENKIFILINNNIIKIPKTLKSRCIVFKFQLTNKEVKDIVYNHFGIDYLNEDLKNFQHYSFTPGFYIGLIDFLNEQNFDIQTIEVSEVFTHIFEKKLYKTNLFIKNNITCLFQLFFLKNLNINNYNYFNLYKYFLEKLNNVINYNLDLDTFLIDFKEKMLNGK